MSLISVTDHASTLFHAWLGGRSKHFPGALAYINAEIEADMAWEPDRQHADDVWEVGQIAYRMASVCSCPSARDGHGCEHEALLEAHEQGWLDAEVQPHANGSECDECHIYDWDGIGLS